MQTRRFLAWFRQVVLSYDHVDGDFNPRRVTAARVTEVSTHEGSMKNQPCLSHHRHHPRRTCLTRVDLHEVGDLLARTKSLVQLHYLDGGSQVAPNQSRRHHSPKGNRWCVDDELLALVLQMIVSPTLNSLSQIWIWWKDDLSGKQVGEGQRSRFMWLEWIILTSTHEQLVLSQKMYAGSVGMS